MKQKLETIFIERLGNSPKIRVLEYLIETRGLDICLTDLARNSGVSRATLIRMWKNLIKEHLLIRTRDIGRAKLYKLNEKDIFVKKLIEIHGICMIEEAEIGLKKLEAPIPA